VSIYPSENSSRVTFPKTWKSGRNWSTTWKRKTPICNQYSLVAPYQ